MHGVHLLAPIVIEMSKCVVSVRGVSLSVPDVVSTNIDGCSSMRREIDGEVKGVHLRATVSVSMAVGICPGLSISEAGAEVPGVCLAFDNGVSRMLRMKNSKVEGVHLRTTVGVRMAMGVSAGILIDSAVPGVGLAGAVGERCMYWVENGKVKGVHLRAAVHIKVRIGVVP